MVPEDSQHPSPAAPSTGPATGDPSARPPASGPGAEVTDGAASPAESTDPEPGATAGVPTDPGAAPAESPQPGTATASTDPGEITAPGGTARTGADAESPDGIDQRLLGAAEMARGAAVELAGDADRVLALAEIHQEDDHAVSFLFEAREPGYRGWRWCVTLADAAADHDRPVTVSEVVLLPGPEALTAPEWLPWQERVRAGDLGVGDLLPAEAEDLRLVPGYLASDDPAVEETAREVGLGRVRVLSRIGRDEAGERWYDDRGPRAEMARAAPGTCVACGFYLPLAGSMRAAFGVCANEYAPADGSVVHAEYGCGAHSDVKVDPGPIAPVAELVFDDGVELETRPR